MLVLDLDLDFFVDPIAYQVTGSQRLDPGQYQPWSEEAFRRFLENQCCLATDEPRPGQLFTEHHHVFFWWRNLVRQGRLRVPFDVIHVDAHADLGAGARAMECFHFICTELVLWELPARQFPEVFLASRFGPANFLTFAIACRWVNSLIYVTHPRWERNRDLPSPLFRDRTPESGRIQLQGFSKRTWPSPEEFLKGVLLREADPPLREAAHDEPPVTFEVVRGTELKLARAPDFVTLCQSPGYTPCTADRLMTVFREYIAPT